MKLDQRTLSIAFIAVYVVCVIISAYALFTIKDDLVKNQVLDISNLSIAGGVLMKLNFIVFVTLLVGLGALVFLFNNRSEDVIYVEKKKDDKYMKEEGDMDDGDERNIDLTSLKKILGNRTESDEAILKKALVEICKKFDAGMGAFYKVGTKDDKKVVEMTTSYALALGESQMPSFEFGEGLIGQVASEEKTINVDDIPEGYTKIVSGLGNSSPTNLIVSPVKHNNTLYGVVEIASFTAFSKSEESVLNTAFELITKRLAGEEKKAVKKVTKKEKE